MWFVFAARAADVQLGGTVEAFWSHNFNEPENGVTNLRGFDNRADTISLSNVALDVTGSTDALTAKLVLQAGLTPNTYTLAEPANPVAGGVGAGGCVGATPEPEAGAPAGPPDAPTAQAGGRGADGGGGLPTAGDG